MRRFTALFSALDRTTKTSVKVAALRDYFAGAPAGDAALALGYFIGQRARRPVTTRQLRTWVAEVSGLPAWLVDECYAAVGDLGETLALLLPDPERPTDLTLSAFVDERIGPLAHLPETGQRDLVARSWRELDHDQRFVFHKLIGGGFRVGVSRRLVTRALAEVAGVDPAAMAHRLMGSWRPTAERFAELMSPTTEDGDTAAPYPFFLASPLVESAPSLGDIADWQLEWKWDGLRAQLLHRGEHVILWSRGDEILGGAFPEIVELGRVLPSGTVLDGEILAWEDDHPLPFAMVQRRIGRKSVEPMLFPDVPIVFMVFDLLEHDGADLRARPLHERRAMLERLVRTVDHPVCRLSGTLEATTWDDAGALHAGAQTRGTEGLLLKRRSSPYGVGRVRGDWWKWKVDPYTIDAVLMYAYPGSGKRASLYTDYGFGVWDGDELVPICRAYSGLTDEEIDAVDRHVRRTTVERKGPVRIVEPQLVFELGFEGLQESTRHKSGIALRFPRMLRRRTDKGPRDADTLTAVRGLLRNHGRKPKAES